MKPRYLTLGCAVAGFLAGYFLHAPRQIAGPVEETKEVRLSPRKAQSHAETSDVSEIRTTSLVDRAVSLSADQWPAFFEARMNSSEGTRLLERLWAEQDPEGFWAWLKSRHDGNALTRYGQELLRVWAMADPDAAMNAANQITAKQPSDILRREVIETVLSNDLQKGLELAAKALDFNYFSWGPREWMKTDPAGAVRGLAGLPAKSEFRKYLDYAVREWATVDSKGMLEWLKKQAAPDREDWYAKAFTAAAAVDLSSALEVANSMDPVSRDAAISGVLASGRVSENQTIELLGQLTAPKRSQAMYLALDALPLENTAQIESATRLLSASPLNRNMLNVVEDFGRAWVNCDIQRGFTWAESLPDSSMRRGALASMASYAKGPEQFSALAAQAARVPMLDLSNEFFENILRSMPDDQEDAWIARLPKDRAEWARTVASGK